MGNHRKPKLEIDWRGRTGSIDRFDSPDRDWARDWQRIRGLFVPHAAISLVELPKFLLVNHVKTDNGAKWCVRSGDYWGEAYKVVVVLQWIIEPILAETCYRLGEREMETRQPSDRPFLGWSEYSSTPSNWGPPLFRNNIDHRTFPLQRLGRDAMDRLEKQGTPTSMLIGELLGHEVQDVANAAFGAVALGMECTTGTVDSDMCARLNTASLLLIESLHMPEVVNPCEWATRHELERWGLVVSDRTIQRWAENGFVGVRRVNDRDVLYNVRNILDKRHDALPLRPLEEHV